ncbi:hypothetical protein V8D89_001720 [Ganoderma adspersum]
MQSLLEYEAEERRYQSLAEAEDEGVEDTDVTPAPPSYAAEATATPWVPREILPPNSEVAFGIALDSIPEDDTPPGSPMLVMSSPAPLAHAENFHEPPADYHAESPTFQDSDLDSDVTLAELSLTVNEPAQATGVSYRVRPVHWAPSPIVKARELVEFSPRSQVTHRRPGSRQDSNHSAILTRGRSRSRDSASSRRPSSENHPSRSRTSSRQNSDSTSRYYGPLRPALRAEAASRISMSHPGSRESSLNSYPGGMPGGMLLDAQALASGHTLVDDYCPCDITHAYPPTYGPPHTHIIPERSSRPSASTATIGGHRAGGSGNVYMHANYNYSNPTIYPNMVSAAGLNYGTPFGSPMAYAPAAIPPMSPRAPLFGQMPAPSRNSTGNYPLHTALDAMQSPSLGPATPAGYVDVEMLADVQRNASAWKPTWDVFPLKVYRGYDLKVIAVQRDWDDEDLLRELGAAYDKLRGRLRKYFSFKDVWWAEKQYVFPQRVGPAKISAHRNMRMRYLLAHPAHMHGQREIMRALTARRGFGVEFVEQARLARMALFTCGLFFSALAVVIGYGARTGDWIGAFSIGSFFGQNFALPVGLLQVAASMLMREC